MDDEFIPTENEYGCPLFKVDCDNCNPECDNYHDIDTYGEFLNLHNQYDCTTA